MPSSRPRWPNAISGQNDHYEVMRGGTPSSQIMPNHRPISSVEASIRPSSGQSQSSVATSAMDFATRERSKRKIVEDSPQLLSTAQNNVLLPTRYPASPLSTSSVTKITQQHQSMRPLSGLLPRRTREQSQRPLSGHSADGHRLGQVLF